MKTLKESLLGDLDAKLDSYDDIIKNGMNELSKCLSTAKNYSKMSKIYRNGRCTSFTVLPELFSIIGLDANKIEIVIYEVENVEHELGGINDWYLNIFINKRDPYNKLISSTYDTSVYLYDGFFSTFNDILKKLFKPMTKDIETFKRSLEKLKKQEGQLITQPNEILK